MKHKLNSIIIILIFFCSFISAQYKIKNYDAGYKGQTIFDIVNEREENINIGLWALIIAKEYDSTIDVPGYLSKLDEMSLEIKKMLAGRTKDMDKFLAVKTYLYESGVWNNNKPFSYDLDDPLGNGLKNQLLNTYIDKRKGNCISMPTLFISLMERVASHVSFNGVAAPLHLFCRLRDKQSGDVWNVETTNGGNPARNQWYIETMHISQTAIDKGLYLRDLTKKEYIAELIGTLIRKEKANGNFEKALKYSELVLKLSPNSSMGLVSKGALIAEIGYRESKEGKLSDEKKEYYREESDRYIEKAESLGWRQESKEEKDKYLEKVNAEKIKEQKEGK